MGRLPPALVGPDQFGGGKNFHPNVSKQEHQNRVPKRHLTWFHGTNTWIQVMRLRGDSTCADLLSECEGAARKPGFETGRIKKSPCLRSRGQPSSFGALEAPGAASF